MEALPVEQIEVFQDPLCVAHGGTLFLLDLDHEPVQLLGVHESVVRVLIEQCLDFRRRLGRGQLEPSLEAPAEFVGLSGHNHREREREGGVGGGRRSEVDSLHKVS